MSQKFTKHLGKNKGRRHTYSATYASELDFKLSKNNPISFHVLGVKMHINKVAAVLGLCHVAERTAGP